MATVSREGALEAGVSVEPSAVWKARPASGTASPLEEHAIPRFRRRKATRCCHCDFCRPHGGAGGVRLCTAPGRSGELVIGDQTACAQYQPVVL